MTDEDEVERVRQAVCGDISCAPECVIGGQEMQCERISRVAIAAMRTPVSAEPLKSKCPKCGVWGGHFEWCPGDPVSAEPTREFKQNEDGTWFARVIGKPGCMTDSRATREEADAQLSDAEREWDAVSAEPTWTNGDKEMNVALGRSGPASSPSVDVTALPEDGEE